MFEPLIIRSGKASPAVHHACSGWNERCSAIGSSYGGFNYFKNLENVFTDLQAERESWVNAPLENDANNMQSTWRYGFCGLNFLVCIDLDVVLDIVHWRCKMLWTDVSASDTQIQGRLQNIGGTDEW